MGLTERDLHRVGDAVCREQDRELAELDLLGTDERLAAIHRREGAPRPRRGGRAWVVAVAATIAIAATAVLFLRGERAISYRVAGTEAAPGQWVGADDQPVSLEFSEGSRIDVTAGARARVTELDADGASLVIERGKLHVSVVHREASRWLVGGGPFAVHVVGTEFDVAWDPSTEVLEVAMASGRVEIDGPCLGGARAVRAPETIEISCAISARADAPRVATTDVPPIEAAHASPDRVTPSPASAAAASGSAATPAGDPIDLAASGHELVEQGSAARLAGDAALARRFYEGARRRFPSTDAAAIAAYHLGRMAFDGKHAWAEAERWFGVYLSERPGGALAPEALGRSMECADKRGDAADARALATRYLAAYPKGAQAALAERLATPESP